MRSERYTDSELGVMDDLDRLFWIELAKRKAFLIEGDELAALQNLRLELEAYFEALEPELEWSLDYGTDALFDSIQFNKDLSAFASSPEHLEILKRAGTRFTSHMVHLLKSLTYLVGFRLADFSAKTDLPHLHSWWTYINSTQGRKELGTKGKFSTLGEPRLVPAEEDLQFDGSDTADIKAGELIQTMSSYCIPVRIPVRVIAGPQAFVFSTDEHEITIDGNRLENRLVLDIGLSKPLPTMRGIEALLLSALGSVRARRTWAEIKAGVFSEELLVPKEEIVASTLVRFATVPPRELQLMTAQNSAVPMITGLYCWDFVHHEDLTKAKAAERVEEELGGSNKNILYGLKIVSEAVAQYEPGQLPWIS